MKKSLSAKQVTWLLTLVYFTGYLTRINFASIIQSVVTETGFSKSALSAIPVCLFVAYAVGQVINGRLGDKIQPQSLILCGLGCSSIINIVFPFCSTSIPLMCVLWGINGFVQAMLWPPIIQIMVRSMSEREYNSNVALLTIGSTGAKVAIFLLAPLVISVGGWKSVLFICSGFGIATTVAFLLLKDRIVMQPLPVSEQPNEKKQGFRLPRASVMPILFIFLAIILHGMLRDGLDDWMRQYREKLAEWERGRNDYYYSGEQYLDGMIAYEKGKKALNEAADAIQKLQDAEQEIADKRAELEDAGAEAIATTVDELRALLLGS